MSEQSGEAAASPIVITEATELTDELSDAVEAMLPQLSETAVFDRGLIERAVASEATHLYVATLDGAIVGTASLCIYPIPTGLRGHIEDVVVGEAARGHGLARRLIDHLVAEGRRMGLRTIDLTSRPSRTAAIRLYETSGFVKRDTNVYRYQP